MTSVLAAAIEECSGEWPKENTILPQDRITAMTCSLLPRQTQLHTPSPTRGQSLPHLYLDLLADEATVLLNMLGVFRVLQLQVLKLSVWDKIFHISSEETWSLTHIKHDLIRRIFSSLSRPLAPHSCRLKYCGEDTHLRLEAHVMTHSTYSKTVKVI